MLVRDVMQTDVLTVAPDDVALTVGGIMEERRIGSAIVCDGGVFQGIVSKETFFAKAWKLKGPFEDVRVSNVMEFDVDTVKADTPLREAVSLLLTQKGIIDLLPVVDGEEVVGLLTKQALTSLFAKNMRRRFKVGDLMHYEPLTVDDYTPLDRVFDELMRASAKRVLVLSGDRLVGIISVRDLSVMLFLHKKQKRPVESTSTITAEDVMTPDPITISRKADAAAAADIMVEKKIGAIPVMNDGLDGIISRTDMLKAYQLILD